MPRGDGTGPMGMGAMTGRAAGYCAGYAVPGYANPIPGRGFGFGRGMGMGFRGGRGGFGGGRGYYGAMVPTAPYAMPYPATPYAASPTAQQEADMLKGQAEYFEGAMADIKKRLAELEKTEEAK